METAAPRLSGIAVLVVEDDPDHMELVATTLERAGAKVIRAASATEGREALASGIPSLLVVDVYLPDEDALQFIAGVRSDTRVAHVPAIALTADSRATTAVATLSAGFQTYLAKPFDPASLVERASELTRRSR